MKSCWEFLSDFCTDQRWSHVLLKFYKNLYCSVIISLLSKLFVTCFLPSLTWKYKKFSTNPKLCSLYQSALQIFVCPLIWKGQFPWRARAVLLQMMDEIKSLWSGFFWLIALIWSPFTVLVCISVWIWLLWKIVNFERLSMSDLKPHTPAQLIESFPDGRKIEKKMKMKRISVKSLA